MRFFFFFRGRRNDRFFSLDWRKYWQIDAVPAELPIEIGTQLFGEAADDSLELNFFGLFLFVRVENLTAEGQARSELAGPAERKLDRVTGRVEHRKLDDLRDQESDRDGDVLGGVNRVHLEIDAESARFFGRARAKLGRELGDQRPQGNPPILLHLREMITMDD